jgi:hypothetical protein
MVTVRAGKTSLTPLARRIYRAGTVSCIWALLCIGAVGMSAVHIAPVGFPPEAEKLEDVEETKSEFKAAFKGTARRTTGHRRVIPTSPLVVLALRSHSPVPGHLHSAPPANTFAKRNQVGAPMLC